MMRKLRCMNTLASAVLMGSMAFFSAVSSVDAQNAVSLPAEKSVSGKAEALLKNTGVTYFTVNPLSNIKRTDSVFPEDGTPCGTLNVIAAQDEYEPCSFMLLSNQDINGVQISVSDLTGKNSVIPSSAVDVKIVKVWVQTGCAWYSYFADTAGRELIPELLLNDENFIRVDKQNMQNYIREITGDSQKESYIWISSPTEYSVTVNGHNANIADAKTLQPFSLKKNEFKQIWLTVHVPENAEGIYQGTVTVKISDAKKLEVPLSVRALPFKLPLPMTNYDLSRVYYTSSYNECGLARYVQANGGNVELAEKKLKNEYESFRKHNLINPMLPNYTGKDKDLYLRNLMIYRDAGLDTDTVFDAIRGISDYEYLTSKDRKKPLQEQDIPAYWASQTAEIYPELKKIFGKDTTVYCFGWDEPWMGLLRAERAPWRFLHQNGLKTYSTAHGAHLLHAGFNEDFVDYGGSFNKDDARLWHSFGSRISCYANPHTGPENPDFVRRTHGMALYLEDADGTNNYEVNGSLWNDFGGAEYNYRSFNWVYPTVDGHVETIEFEAFREAIDDVKYATLLRQLANKAIQSGNVDYMYQGKAALQWLILTDAENCDLNTLRLEMIDKIMMLRNLK